MVTYGFGRKHIIKGQIKKFLCTRLVSTASIDGLQVHTDKYSDVGMGVCMLHLHTDLYCSVGQSVLAILIHCIFCVLV